jgi:hypothetical protein
MNYTASMNIYAIGGMHKIPAGREENFAGISCRICRNLLSYGCCPPGNRKEVGMLYILISFLVSVAAGIACHCLCRWLDERKKGS